MNLRTGNIMPIVKQNIAPSIRFRRRTFYLQQLPRARETENVRPMARAAWNRVDSSWKAAQ